MKMLQPYLGGTGQQPHIAGPCLFPRAPAGPPWPARLAPPTRSQMAYTLNLPEKLNATAYIRSLGRPQIVPRYSGQRLGHAGPPGLPARTEAAIKQRRRQTRTTRRSGRQPARSTASISPQSRLIAHEYRNAVKHVFQASFELPVPAVLGEASRQAVQRRVAPGVNRVRGIEQLTGAVRVLDCLSLLSRADRAQAADNRGRGRLPGGSAAIVPHRVRTGEGAVARFRIAQRHGAGFQKQVAEQEAVEC